MAQNEEITSRLPSDGVQDSANRAVCLRKVLKCAAQMRNMHGKKVVMKLLGRGRRVTSALVWREPNRDEQRKSAYGDTYCVT